VPTNLGIPYLSRRSFEQAEMDINARIFMNFVRMTFADSMLYMTVAAVAALVRGNTVRRTGGGALQVRICVSLRIWHRMHRTKSYSILYRRC
jgi:hypothetical protein